MLKLKNYIELNPKEHISKGEVVRQVTMADLEPFNRDIKKCGYVKYKSGTKFRNGDTLLARITPCLENGKTSFVNFLKQNEVAVGSTEFYVLRAIEGKMDPNYLYYLSISKKFRKSLIKSMTGTSGRQRATKEAVLDYDSNIPDIDNQKSISHKLSLIDDMISVNNQINDNLFELAKIFFDYVKTSTTKKFSDIVSIQNGFAFKSKNYVKDKQLVILRTKNINSNNLFKSKDVVYIPYSLKDQYSRFAFKKFDSVLVMIGSNIGKTGFVTSNNLPSLQNQNMWRFRSTNKNISGLLIYEYVNFINNKVKNSAVGSARAFYKKELFVDYPVPIIKKDNNFVFKKLELEINNICKETDTLLLLKELLLNIYF